VCDPAFMAVDLEFGTFSDPLLARIDMGGPTPFVLPKFDNRENQFHLIRDSYVHEIMQGKVLSLEGLNFAISCWDVTQLV